jgi:hypothetical protein
MRKPPDDCAVDPIPNPGGTEEANTRLINRLFDNQFSNLGRRDLSISAIILAWCSSH